MEPDPRLSYHRSQAIRDPHHASYHEARIDLIEARAELERQRALLDRAWDVIPEGYTVLRGEILTAVGRDGCTDCGYDCTENPCTLKRGDLAAS